MRTYSLAALVLATIGTGLLSGIVLVSGLSMMPDLPGIDGAALQTQLKSANQTIDGTPWFWIVVTFASTSITLTIMAMLTKVRAKHQLLGRVAAVLAMVTAVQFLLDAAGISSLNTAFAHVQAPLQSSVAEAGWAAPERMRILLAGAALVSFIYAVALCVQVVHDNRGTRRT